MVFPAPEGRCNPRPITFRSHARKQKQSRCKYYNGKEPECRNDSGVHPRHPLAESLNELIKGSGIALLKAIGGHHPVYTEYSQVLDPTRLSA